MSNNIEAAKAWPEPNAQSASTSRPAASTDGGTTGTKALEQSGNAEAPQSQSKPDVRLMIEEDKNTHTFIYKLVDSASGKTLAEIPHEQMSQLSNSPFYAAGDVLSTSA